MSDSTENPLFLPMVLKTNQPNLALLFIEMLSSFSLSRFQFSDAYIQNQKDDSVVAQRHDKNECSLGVSTDKRKPLVMVTRVINNQSPHSAHFRETTELCEDQ